MSDEKRITKKRGLKEWMSGRKAGRMRGQQHTESSTGFPTGQGACCPASTLVPGGGLHGPGEAWLDGRFGIITKTPSGPSYWQELWTLVHPAVHHLPRAQEHAPFPHLCACSHHRVLQPAPRQLPVSQLLACSTLRGPATLARPHPCTESHGMAQVAGSRFKVHEHAGRGCRSLNNWGEPFLQSQRAREDFGGAVE